MCRSHTEKIRFTSESANTKTTLSGKAKLTDKVITSLQNYFGQAIRQNKGELYKMKKAVAAVLWHCTDIEETKRHRYCPRETNSWCKWQRDQLTGKKTHRNSINIPEWSHDILQPVFQELSSDDLLSKCLHGKTQNANEALNNIIWQKCPKNVFVKRDVLEVGVKSAVIHVYTINILYIHTMFSIYTIFLSSKLGGTEEAPPQ